MTAALSRDQSGLVRWGRPGSSLAQAIEAEDQRRVDQTAPGAEAGWWAVQALGEPLAGQLGHEDICSLGDRPLKHVHGLPVD